MPSAKADTVLVVEDDRGIRALVATALEEEGFRVEEVGDGAAALKAIDDHHPLPV